VPENKKYFMRMDSDVHQCMSCPRFQNGVKMEERKFWYLVIGFALVLSLALGVFFFAASKTVPSLVYVK
jgi:hypothetical protein